ncbi:hypothetical protein [Nocardia sp. NPDC050717]|uniref:hypothetical protein n=1 Tax=Nocardia sp. NPDC050717 TaxID=3157221 RepID=UPI0033C9C49C
MSYSPIEDLVAEHLRRVRMLRVEFEDERARLQAKGDAFLAAARDAEQRAAEQEAPQQDNGREEPPTEPHPAIDLDAVRREEQQREAMAHAAAERARAIAEEQATGQRPALTTQQQWPPADNATTLHEDQLREAREAIARSAAARRAAERVEPIDYDGYDQESEYFRGRNWFG